MTESEDVYEEPKVIEYTKSPTKTKTQIETEIKPLTKKIIRRFVVVEIVECKLCFKDNWVKIFLD